MALEFDDLCRTLNQVTVIKRPHNEREIEMLVLKHLKRNNIDVHDQQTSRLGRYDIVVRTTSKRICIELKNNATQSCVEQLDRYARDFDGLILMCYRATDALRNTFKVGKRSAKIPIELIEIRKNCDLI